MELESSNFWKGIILGVLFFSVTPIVILVSLISLISLNTIQLSSNSGSPSPNLLDSPKFGVRVYASLPESFPSISGVAITSDARPQILKEYLTRYDSPLASSAQLIVDVADEYGLDFRLTTAIAQQESNLCSKIPADSYNCWGWGIHSRGSLGFNSYEEGIKAVSKGLREEYINKGYTTPDEIMSKYTPLSDGSWAYGVNQFMETME